MLHTEPSFCIYADEDGFSENEKRDLGVKSIERRGSGSGEFSFGRSMGLIVEDDGDDRLNEFRDLGIGEKEEDEEIQPLSPKMYLATGFGVDGIDGKGNSNGFDDDDEYYKQMVDEDPSNPLFLRNYAQLLQAKGDLTGAEDCYFRATLEDPNDGESLMQYAKLVWELHHDQDRALSYFERAARAAPQDCTVLAAYTSFLWEIDIEDEDNDQGTEHGGLFQKSLEVEETEGQEGYYKRMVDENPCNPSLLKDYARFLRQSKEDLEGAEEYYSRAICADPGDGQVISEYAQLVWEVHHDQDKASCYFNRAVEAASADSIVLAAYAKFLWEAEDEEDHAWTSKNESQLSVLQDAATPA